MRRVAAISAPLRSANPRGRRGLSLLDFSGLSVIIRPVAPRVVAPVLRSGKGRTSVKRTRSSAAKTTETASCHPHQHSEQPPSPTTSKPTGYRSRRTARPRRRRGSSRAPGEGAAGRSCTTAGRSRDPIVEAIQAEAAELDYAPAFQFSHPKAFELASRVAALAPGDLDHVFFCNSGSEAVDTALKIALAYHNVRGEGARTRLIGRERGCHGVGFGGISVGGMVNNRKLFGALLAGVDHLPTTYNREHQAFSRGEPDWGAHLADELERIGTLHDASTIAAVIIEPMAGSTGVLPAPKGYLPRLRAICDKHGILLIFDEVITAYGRLGHAFAAERYGVVPDMITFAKGITSGSVPMGGVLVRKGIYDAFMRGPMHVAELFHGYTYSAHPLACAAGLATLD